jgi:glutamyl-tRNA synthetase
MSEIRVRIAPSPSGFLHIGTARAALFNFLFARHNDGKFLLRIEDTDVARSSKEMVDIIFSSLNWLGLQWDEPPVFQSQRLDIHKKYTSMLLESGKAYQCWCSPERLKSMQDQAQKNKINYRYDRHCLNLPDDEKKRLVESGEPFATRLHVPEGSTSFHDLILGDLTNDNSLIDDFIIARRDGRAIYNMAVVVDDHEMRISHVIRGNDHVKNTYRQLLIYKALGLAIPQFAHLPLILEEDRSKMSKSRPTDQAVAVSDFEKKGFLKEAVVNFISLLGWSPGGDKEIMTMDEMISLFSIDKINPTNAIFDMTKLRWMNGEYIRKYDDNQLIDLLRPFLMERGLTTNLWINTRWSWMLQFVKLMKERCHLLTDFAEQGAYFFIGEFNYEPKGVEKHFMVPDVDIRLERWINVIQPINNFSGVKLEEELRNLSESMQLKPADLIHPIRLALSGVTGGPPLFDMMELLGKDECLSRLGRAIDFIKKIHEKSE